MSRGWLAWLVAVCLLAGIVDVPGAQAQGIVEAPVIRAGGQTSADGIFRYLTRDPVVITLSAGPDAAEIYYTTDGTDPDPGLPGTLRYSLNGSFSVEPPAVVRAVAESAQFDYSEVSEARLQFVASYTVTDASQGGGGFSVSPAAADYPLGATVTLTANPQAGWQFVRWEGDLSGTNPVSPLVINGAKTVRAIFGTPIQTSVNSISGQSAGAVAVDPPVGPYPYGATVRLMALPALGRAFSGWTNNTAWTNQQLLTVVVTNANPAFRALFNSLASTSGSNTVSLKVTGGGSLMLSPEAPRSVYRTGSVVQVRPVPDPGWVFEGWSGDAVGAANPLSLTVNTNKVVTAVFSRRPPGEPIVEGLDLAEYFWDTAPLEGQGIRIPLGGGDIWATGPRSVDVSALEPGLHRLGLRVRDDQRRWSDIQWIPFMVEASSDLLAGVGTWPEVQEQRQLVAAEYFWDNDPGVGRATALLFTPGETWVTNSAAALNPLISYPPGSFSVVEGSFTWAQAKADAEARGGYLATFASQDEWARGSTVAGSRGLWIGAYQAANKTEPAGGWAWVTGESWGFTAWGSGEPNNGASPTEDHAHITSSTAAWNDAYGETKMGYLLEMPATPPATGGENGGEVARLSLAVSALSPGLHQLGVRVKEASGRWSEVTWSPLQVEASSDLLAGVATWPEAQEQRQLVAAEYFWDVDPGAGFGTGVPMAPGETWVSPSDVDVVVDALSAGLHQFGFRVRENSGRWSPVTWTPVKVEESAEMLAAVEVWPALEEEERLVTAEYFWDEDPGQGAGIRLTIPAAYSYVTSPDDIPGVKLNVPALSLGVHRLGFRVQDGRFRWSETVWRPFQVDRDPGLVAGSPTNTVPGTNTLLTLAVGGSTTGSGPVWLAGENAGLPMAYRWLASGLETNALSGFAGVDGIRTAAWGDLNNDGLSDLALGLSEAAGGGVRVFLNRGNGQFERMASNLLDSQTQAFRSVGWSDLDRDGLIDLVLFSPSAPAVRIFKNVAGNAFEEREAPVVGAGANALTVAEFTGDSFPDLVSVDSSGVRLHRNRSGAGFVEVPLPALPDPTAIVGTVPLDLDNDGDLDLLVVSGTRGGDLLKNAGTGSFSIDAAAGVTRTGLAARSAAATDLDGDGWIDVVMVNDVGSLRLFRNRRDGSVAPDENVLDLDGIGKVAIADVDASGTPDLLVAGPGERMVVLTNSLPGTRWVRVRPRSASSNRSAIGARIAVTALLDGRLITQVREVLGSDGFGGQDEGVPLFGLGDAAKVEAVRIEWPSGLRTEVRNVAVNQDLVVDEVPEGSPVVRVNGEFRPNHVHEFTAHDEVEVTLSSSFPGAQIHYSLDGFPADIRSTRYTGAFRVAPPAIIRATAYSAGYLDYAEAEAVRLVFIPSYPLSAGTDGGGSVQVAPSLTQYRSNSTVQVTATAAAGWSFLRWEGDVSGAVSPITVTMDGPKNVRAVFGTAVSTTVTGGAANGTVAVEPASSLHAFGSKVRLAAIPATGRGFQSWNANAQWANSLLTVHVTNANPAYNAIFVPLRSDERSLVLRVNGQGTIVSDPGRGILPAGSSVTLTAVADEQWVFEGWSGDLSGSEPNRVLSMDANHSVTATFRKLVVETPPSITLQPNDATLATGQALDLQVAATGSIPLRYQWYFGSQPLNDEVTPLLSLVGLKETNSGSYSVVVNNDFGSVTSRIAQVTVARPPNRSPLAAMRAPVSGTVFEFGQSVPLSVYAADPDGVLDRVEFFLDGASLGLGQTLSGQADIYGRTVLDLAPGSHVFYARAYDREGAVAATETTGFAVSVPPVTRFSMAESLVTTTETNGVLRVRVVKAGVGAGSVQYTTRTRSAQVGRDFREASGRLEFTESESAKFIDLQLLDEFVPDGVRELDVLLLEASPGTELGAATRTLVSVRDNDGDVNTASLLDFQISGSRPGSPGALRVSLNPPGEAGEWRLAWETFWRRSGTQVTNLDAGTYRVEFRPAMGYKIPAGTNVLVGSGQVRALAVDVASQSEPEVGDLLVEVVNDPAEFPQELSGWRFLGETEYREFGTFSEARPIGEDLIEFRPVTGWIEPVPIKVAIQADLTTLQAVSYVRIPAAVAGASLPIAISRYDLIRDAQTALPRAPYPMVGQLKTPTGYGSGIAVRQRVVLTAAHVLFDETTGQMVPPESIEWFVERHAGDAGYEPIPVKAAGYYVNENYLAARNTERQQPGWKPGTVTPLSQQWDVAAVYFNEPIARNGQAGYLLASESPSQWVASGERSQLVGYPFGTGSNGIRTGQPGRMHVTDLARNLFEAVDGTEHVFASSQFLGLPGHSGGPLLMQVGNGLFPAAVFLGNLGGESVVRVIDSMVASLINRAASSSLLGLNFNGGGVVQTGAGSGSQTQFGYLQFRFLPDSVASAAGWRIATQTNSAFVASGQSKALPVGEYTMEFKAVSGQPTPAARKVSVTSSATASNPLVIQLTYGGSSSSAFGLVPVSQQVINEETPFELQLQGRNGKVPSTNLVYRLVNGPTGLAMTSSGLVTWTPSEGQGPATNLAVRVSLADGTSIVTNSFNVTVREVNRLPGFLAATNRVLMERQPFVHDLQPTDADLPAQTLSFSVLSGPGGLILTNGVLAWTPTEAQGPSTNSVQIVVSDGVGSITNSIILSVLEDNTPPRLAGATNATIDELAGYTQNLMPQDGDLPAQPLTVTLLSGPTGLVVTNGVLAWTPTEAQGPSTNLVTVTVTDGSLTTTNSLTLTVREVNLAPTLAGATNATIDGLVAHTQNLLPQDADLPAQALVVALLSGPAGATISDGVLAWTPTSGQSPSTNLLVARVSDGSALVTNSFTLVVRAASTASRISGIIEYYQASGGRVSGVKVAVGGSGSGSMTTASDGSYSLTVPTADVTITPSRTADEPPANGVTTADITLIRRHVLGLALLDSPHKVMAGDVNGSDSVTTADITLIRRLILGLSTNFTAGLWRFVPSDEVISDPTKPWTSSRMRRYASVAAGDLTGQDFKAIKLGDVNGSWKLPIAGAGALDRSKAKPRARLSLGEVSVATGEVAGFKVRADGFPPVSSVQFSLKWDPKQLEFIGVDGFQLPGLTLGNFNVQQVQNGFLSLSWDPQTGQGVDLAGLTELFQLRFKVLASAGTKVEVSWSDVPTPVEVTVDFEAVAVDRLPGVVTIPGGTPVTAESLVLKVVGPAVDGRVELEIRVPSGVTVLLEGSNLLRPWSVVRTVVGQGAADPIRVVVTQDPSASAEFWRLKATLP